METVASRDDGGIEFRFAFAFLGDDVDDAADGRITVKDAAAPRTTSILSTLLKGNLQPVDATHVRPVQLSAIEHDQGLAERIITSEAAHVDARLRGITAVSAKLNPLQLIQDFYNMSLHRIF